MRVPVTTPSISKVVPAPALPLPPSMPGAGADSLEIQGNAVTVYGGSSADDTADGADTLYVSTLLSSTVYGAAGADSVQLATLVFDSRIEGGAGASTVFGAGALDAATILGGAAADSLSLTGSATGASYFDLAGGGDTLVFGSNGVVGTSSEKATILGGEGNDTLGSGGNFDFTSLLGGAGADSIYTTGSIDDAENSTILGGAGNDVINFAGGSTTSRIKGEAGADTIVLATKVVDSTVTGGAGADSLSFTAGDVTSASIVGGAGNDTFNFGDNLTTNSGSSFYFGSGDGSDSIYFSGTSTLSQRSSMMTIAVDHFIRSYRQLCLLER